MTSSSRLNYRRLGVALLIPFIAAGVQWLLWPHIQPFIWFLFYPAVFFSAWLGGRSGGIVATLLSAGLAVYVFAPPMFSFQLDNPATLFSALVFIGMGGLFSYVFHVLKQANRRLDLMAQLQASERTLQLFVEHAPAAIAMFDRDMRYLAASQRYLADYRLPDQAIVGRLHYDVFPEIPERLKEIHRRCLAGASDHGQAEPFPRADGTLDWVHWEMHPWYEESGAVGGLLLFSEVITERKQAEQRMRYFARLYATLSQVNQTIVRTTDQQALFENICQIAVDYGEFKLAWIGLFERETGQVTPVAEHGYGENRLPFRDLNLQDEPFRSGLVGRALASGRVETSHDIQLDPNMAHWQGVAARDNYHSAAAIPIRLQGQVVGVLNLYAADIDFFAVEEEQKLLAEMGLDISFALDTMQLETERQQTEAALRESEERYRTAQSIGHVGHWEYNLRTTQFWGSDEAKRIYGFDLQQANFSAEEVENCISDRARVHQALVDLIEAGKPYNLEFEIHPKDSSRPKIISSVAELKAGKHGEPLVVGVIHDVTERKQTEAALRDSEARARALIEHAPDGIVLVTATEFKFASPSALKLFGYQQADLFRLSPADLTHPDDLPQVLAALTDLLQNPAQVPTVQYRFLHQDGNWRWIESTFSNLLAEPGVEAIVINFRDITERKQAEGLLHANLARLSLASDAAQAGFWEWDLRTNENIWSEELWKVYGLEPHSCEPSYEAWQQTIHPADRWAAEQAVQVAVQNSTGLNAEYRLNTVPGTAERWLMSRGRPVLDAAGQVARYLGIVIDITARKQVEAALQQSEARYQQFIAQSFEAISRTEFDQPVDTSRPVDEQIDLIYESAYMAECNQAMAAMYHLPLAAGMIGLRLIDAHGGKDNPVNRAAFKKFIEAGYKSMADETLEYTADGEPVWFLSNTVGTVENGQLVRLWGTSLDITDRKRAEAALLDSEKKYRDLINGMNDTICVIDFDTTILDVNTAATRVLGYTREELLSMKISAIDAELTAEQIQGLASSLPHDKLQIFETWHRTKDGRRLPVEVSSSLVSYLGRIVIMSIARDITERKEMDAKVRESEEKFRALYENAPLAYQSLNEAGCFRDVNPAWLQTLGYELPDVIGRHFSEFLHPDYVAHFNRNFPEFKRRGYVHGVEFKLKHKAGHYLDVAYEGCIGYWPDGRFRQTYCVFQNITQRKQAEAAVLQINAELEKRVAQRTAQLAAANDRLLDLDRLKSKFVSDVSHELRTPVTSLSLYIDLLEHGKPEKREQYVGKLKEQMARLHKLINDILDLSRLERDRDEGGRSPADINSIVEHVTATQLIAAETAGLVLTCDVGDNLPAVIARPDQLTRAITNVVSNAIKYTPTGSVRVQTRVYDQRVCIEVSDTGRGIPADELPHLFERFYRGHAVAQSTIPGTGLGLSIVKEIIESHGGAVEVQSELGQGSTFFIWLPIA